MALTYFGELAIQAGTTSATLTWPASVQAGDLAVAFTVSKLSGVVPADPTGWLRTGWARAVGTGADAADAGLVRLGCWYYVLPTATPANPVFNVASGNSLLAHGVVFRKGAGDFWDTPVMTYADRNTLSTTFSGTGVSQLGILPTDIVVGFSGATRNSAITSGRSLTIAGVTGSQTQVTAAGTNNGNHLYAWTDYLTATSGIDTVAPVAAATFGASQAGGSLFVRLGISRRTGMKVSVPSEVQMGVSRDWGLTTFLARNRTVDVNVEDGLTVKAVTASRIWGGLGLGGDQSPQHIEGQIWPRGDW